MKRLVRVASASWLLGLFALDAPAAFTSLYVFGDGVCTTTDNTSQSAYYYGQRYCNGRVWVEVLAQRQGLAYDPGKNWSYYGDDSSQLIANVANFLAPADANTALFVVWVNDADFVDSISAAINLGRTTDIAFWNPVINQALTNHLTAIQTLYAKGARTLVMPNAVDITKIPFYASMSADKKAFIHQRVIDFNAGFSATLNQAKASFPNLTVYLPDMFTLLDTMIAHPGDYGLTNTGIDAVGDSSLADISLNGPGANYLFWDDTDPSAKAHVAIADLAQQLISPVKLSKITWLNGTNRLDAVNIPIGLDGFVDSSTNLVNWTGSQNITSTNASQTTFIPATGSRQFYRLRFPFAWSWP